MKAPVSLDVELPCQRRPELYLTDDTNTQRVAAAKFHCLTCPLLQPCFEWSVLHEKFLVWGATSPQERDAIREARGIVVETPVIGVAYPTRRPGQEHGDEAGYKRHMRRDEPACRACYEGNLRARQDRSAKRRNAS